MIPVVTIDGPSCSGKGTISCLLAKQLGWRLLDSGAVYRILALDALRKNVVLDDIAGLQALAAKLESEFLVDENMQSKIMLFNEDVTEAIRAEDCSMAASKIGVFPEVRTALLQLQRDFRKEPGLVADGRDMGTVVFTDAILKVFLTASARERATRRYQQLKSRGINGRVREILQDLIARDGRDSKRAVAPLQPAVGAKVIDTTKQSVEETLQEVMDYVQAVL